MPVVHRQKGVFDLVGERTSFMSSQTRQLGAAPFELDPTDTQILLVRFVIVLRSGTLSETLGSRNICISNI